MIQYEDYNKVSDVFLRIGRYGQIRIVATLNYLSVNKNKINFHTEVQTDAGIKINRNFSFYLSFEKLSEPRGFVMIRVQDMMLLQRKLEQIESWFKGEQVFFIKKKQLFMISGAVKPIILSGLAQDKYLQFDPVITSREDTGEVSPGLRITLGDPEAFLDIDLDTYYALTYMIQRADLFGYAQNLANYLGRPEFGHNLFVAESQGASQTYDDKDKITGGVKRDIKKKNTSFFNQKDYDY